ncbi:myrosinase 1-like [Periplaneta americana]|uniref:myrosinase 1-like n=1 Tax=Periplaneta americana TaxID=6978 RepID=UPI0037E8C417
MTCDMLPALLMLLNMQATGLGYTFPDGFMFGASTSAYQTEGAWNVDGRGPTIWDTTIHAYPDVIADHSNADDADLSYYKFKEDSHLVKDMGMHFYSFSISWTRIMPTGLANSINVKGLEHYNKVIDDLLEKGITPIVKMYHFDMPQYLQNLGGWTNPYIIGAFKEYARILFKNFGDRVQYWATMNEPNMECLEYEASQFIKVLNFSAPGVGCYLALRNMLLAHAEVYHLYDKEFRPSQNGRISIIINLFWYEPLNPKSTEDQEAVIRQRQIDLGWFAHPVYSTDGDYPQLLKDRVAANSKKEGFPSSRLQYFTPEEIKFVRGTADFFALNHYATFLVTSCKDWSGPSLSRDIGTNTSALWWLPSQPLFPEISVAPEGIRRVLNYIKQNFGDWEILITENGFPDAGGLNDPMRQLYIGTYLAEILKAIHIDGVKVFGYAIWSIIDNFEWNKGYTTKFGLYSVNFSDPRRPRTPKDSAKLMKEIISTHKVPNEYLYLGNELSLDVRPAH